MSFIIKLVFLTSLLGVTMPTINQYINKATLKIIKDETAKEITKASNKYGVDANLIKAIIRKESDWVVNSIRVEHHLKKAKWYVNTLSPLEKTNDFAYCSMGLMQIMYGVAKHDLGFKGKPFALFEPKANIDCGTKHLRNLLKRFKSVDDAISSYNQGSPRKTNGKYNNQYYVNTVKRFYKEYSN